MGMELSLTQNQLKEENMSENKISRSTYLNKNIGDFAQDCKIGDINFTKVDDLRYGTNPHQPAAYYKIEGIKNPIGDMKILKNGKNGLSQTNLEDISYSVNIVKFFDRPTCAVMKHVNPSGAATQAAGDSVKDVYIKARNSDPRAAFGSFVCFNTEVDKETAEEIMSSFVEGVAAPSYTEEAMAVFTNPDVKMNKSIRIIQIENMDKLPKFIGDANIEQYRTIKVLCDGSLIIADPLLTNLKSVADVRPAAASSKALGDVVSTAPATEQQIEDLLSAWYININVRSNGVVIMKNGGALAVGTGEQDRVGAVEQAIIKFNDKYEGTEAIQGSVMSSDGFFPFPDAVEVAAKAGVTAIISPAGSIKDAAVIARANELGVALFHAPERIFSHH